MNKIKKIFTLDLALKLLDMGNKLIYSEPNKKFPQFQVFAFKDTEKLRKDWNTINK